MSNISGSETQRKPRQLKFLTFIFWMHPSMGITAALITLTLLV